MTNWTDAHCHLQDQFLGDTDDSLMLVTKTLERARVAGVDTVVVIGTDRKTSEQAVALVEAYKGPVRLAATIGLHPHDAKQGVHTISDLARAGDVNVVGIGECGLDYFYEHSPRDQQRDAFVEQIRLAHELSLALVIHARDAWDDIYEILNSEGVPERTVIHCFTGGPREAERCLELGCDISISGVVTFKNSSQLREAVRIVPLDRLHVETDSPFLAPVPHRGRANEPAFVVAVGTYLAELLQLEVAVVQRATTANTARLFALS